MNPISFTFSATQNGLYKCEPVDKTAGVQLYRIRMRWTEKKPPEPVTLRFSLPVPDTYSVFDCRRVDRAKSWGGVERTSRLAADMPLIQLISKSGQNRYLFTLSDVKTPVKLKISCDYHTMTATAEFFFFTAPVSSADSYHCLLRIDTRSLPFYDALYDARDWFSSFGYAPAKTPSAAKDPVYSTWYAYGTAVTAEDVACECAAAKALGMDTVIIDDGWQRGNDASVYGYCGDWTPYPEKFPDMAGLTARLHAAGMKVVLWYSVPFVGKYAENYRRFEGKYLRELPDCDCAVLDPRYQDVREFIVGVYVRAVRAWGLDGLKLDFIDRFSDNGSVTPEMDFISVEDAVQALLSEIYGALTAIDPEILLEFRQPYSGPVVTSFGNMLRAWDCPGDPMTNRIATLNLRFTTGACVHSDMIRWHPEESPEQAAVALWGTLFSVPQISVRIKELTHGQRVVLRRYLCFWRAHRETLLNGKLTAQSPEGLFGYTAASTQAETVALCVSQNYVDLTKEKRAYVCNLTENELLALQTDPSAHVRVLDCFGECLEERPADPSGLMAVHVPLCGMAEVYMPELSDKQ